MEVQNDHMIAQKCCVITLYFISPYTLHSKTLMVIFEGNPSGSPNKSYIAMISNQNSTKYVRDPSEFPQFLSFNIATTCTWGHIHSDGALMCTQVAWNINDFIAPLNPELHSQ